MFVRAASKLDTALAEAIARGVGVSESISPVLAGHLLASLHALVRDLERGSDPKYSLTLAQDVLAAYAAALALASRLSSPKEIT